MPSIGWEKQRHVKRKTVWVWMVLKLIMLFCGTATATVGAMEGIFCGTATATVGAMEGEVQRALGVGTLLDQP